MKEAYFRVTTEDGIYIHPGDMILEIVGCELDALELGDKLTIQKTAMTDEEFQALPEE